MLRRISETKKIDSFVCSKWTEYYYVTNFLPCICMTLVVMIYWCYSLCKKKNHNKNSGFYQGLPLAFIECFKLEPIQESSKEQ
jgi:hypothetical protein